MRRILSIYVLTLGLSLSLLGCGGGGGSLPSIGGPGGNNAAPTGGADSPVAVEIPAVNDIGNLVYVTGEVMGGAVAMSQSKSLNSMAAGGAGKGMGIGTPFSKGKSLAACETSNQFWRMTEVGSQTDLTLCIVQTSIAPAARDKGIDIADGAAHDFKVTFHKNDGTTSRLDLRLSLQMENNTAADFRMQACAGGKQIHHNRQVINGNTVKIHSKDIKDDGRDEVRVDGELNSNFQYMQKRIYSRDAGEKESGGYSHDSTMDQFPHSGTLDGFRTFENNGSTESARLYSVFDLSYGATSLLPDPTSYLIGNGAAHYNAYGTIDATECWNGETQEVDPGSCGPYDDMVAGHALKTVAPVIIPDYTAEETLVCTDVRPEMEVEIDIHNHPCAQFLVEHSDADCVEVTQGAFDVTAMSGGTALSQDSTTPTILEKGAALDLVTNYAAYPESFFKGTIVIQPYDGTTELNYSAQLELGTTSWNDSHTQFQIQPEFQSRTFYQLTLVGKNGLAGAGNKVKMADSRVYYFIVH